MIKEKYQITQVETSFNVASSRLESIRKKNITKTGYRVYQDGLIGVYGQLGQNEEDPWEKALENLIKNRVDYPYEPARQIRREKVVPANLDDNRIMHELEAVLAKARTDHPDFIFSNKVNVTQVSVVLENDLDTYLAFTDKVLDVGLILKHKESIQIMDAFVAYQSRHWDPDYFLWELNRMTEAFNNPIAFPDEELPIVAGAGLLVGKLIEELNGEKVGYQSSLFAKNLGEKVFHDDFTFYLDWDESEQYHVPFFDAEGTIIEEGRVDLIKNGVIEKPYTDKRTADRFNFPLTGSAVCSYDGVPTLGARNFNIDRSSKTLKELLPGGQGIVVAIASGGDYTDEGKFATPVQLGFLTDGVQLLGRLPEFHISGHLYDLFGKDYIGFSKDRFLFGEHALVVRMNCSKT